MSMEQSIWVRAIDFNRNSSQLSVTGSSFNFKSTDGSDLFTLYNNSDEVSVQFDDKVLVLGSTTVTTFTCSVMDCIIVVQMSGF